MNCEYFKKCGSCTLYDKTYEEQLDYKIQREEKRFEDITTLKFDIIKSKEQNFRSRAEFRIWRNFDEQNKPTLSYAMSDFDKKALEIDSCKIVSSHISDTMPKLISHIKASDILSQKLFAMEFLGSSTNDLLVTLIYHKKLDELWIQKAKELEKTLNIKIIGRSRGQKVVLSSEFINEELNIANKPYKFVYQEGGFTQPNTQVNIQMIQWVLQNIEKTNSDLCELYCGGGNFTIPLSSKFQKVLATEISKTSIKAAKINCELNSIKNIEFVRMSSEEFSQALNKQREFTRLKDINLDEYNFSCVFVDPPRAGLDELTRDLIKDFDKIIYISCNPETLHRDLKELTKTHKVLKTALFDQFAYTEHIEAGVVLERI